MAEEEGFVINVSEEDLPKSYILTEKDNEIRLYISPISSATLLKRANSFVDYAMDIEL